MKSLIDAVNDYLSEYEGLWGSSVSDDVVQFYVADGMGFATFATVLFYGNSLIVKIDLDETSSIAQLSGKHAVGMAASIISDIVNDW